MTSVLEPQFEATLLQITVLKFLLPTLVCSILRMIASIFSELQYVEHDKWILRCSRPSREISNESDAFPSEQGKRA